MARPDAYIGTSEVADRLVETKQCPITCGRPTKMTEAGFLALCERHQVQDGVWKYNHRRHPAEKKGWCQVCQGEHRPKELQLVTIAQLQRVEREKKQQPKTTTNGDDMGTRKVKGFCEGGCETNGLQVADNYGVPMCSTCGTIHSHVRNRKETVVAAIRRTDMLGWYVQQLAGETVTVKGESATLDAIAAAVGYVGESPDGLVGAVGEVVRLRDRIDELKYQPSADVCRAMGFDPHANEDELENALLQTIAQLEDLQRNPPKPIEMMPDCTSCPTSKVFSDIRRHVGHIAAMDMNYTVLAVAQTEAILETLGDMLGVVNPMEIVFAVEQLQHRSDVRGPIFSALDDIIRHLGLREGCLYSDVVTAVAQSEAILEHLGAVVGSINPFEIPVVVNALASAFEKAQKQTDSRVERINVLADRVSELERVNLVNEQIFTKLRELVDADGLSNAELPSAISSVIYSSKQSFSELVAIPDTRANIDGLLLDLALDALNGEIQGLTPDRIADLRDAAR